MEHGSAVHVGAAEEKEKRYQHNTTVGSLKKKKRKTVTTHRNHCVPSAYPSQGGGREFERAQELHMSTE
jgi:hypothetical protein